MKLSRRHQLIFAVFAVGCIALAGLAIWLADTGVEIQGGMVLSRTSEDLTIRCLSPDVVVTLEDFGGTIAFANTFPGSVVEGSGDQAVRDGSTISVDADGSKDSYHLATPDADSFKFAVMGDSQGHDDVLALALNASEGCEFIIHCGDLTPSGRDSEFDALHEALSQTDLPVFTTPGNHDAKEGDTTVYESRLAPMNYWFEFSGLTFAFVDSSDLDISEDEIEWLREIFSGADRKVVVTHAPSYDPFGNNHTLDPESCIRFREFVLDEGVDAVFSGHIHAFHQMRVESTDFTITGGAGATLVDGVHHMVVVTVTEDRITCEKVNLEQNRTASPFVKLVGKSGDVLNITYEDLLSLDTVSGYSSYENLYGNVAGQGNYLGVTIAQMVDQVGGIMDGDILRVTSSDAYSGDFGYLNVYPDQTWMELQGDMILALEFEEIGIPDWDDGPRIAFLPQDGLYSNLDCELTSYEGQGYSLYPSAGARWIKYVVMIEVVAS